MQTTPNHSDERGVTMEIRSIQCLENVIPGIELSEFQNIGVQKMLLNKHMLLAFDTGLGKTYTYSVMVRALLNRNPEKKHIFVIIHDSMEQAKRDVSNLVAAPVEAFSAVFSELGRLARMWDRLSVVLVTYECFSDMEFIKFLYEHIEEVESFVTDEAHHAANWDSSNIAFIIRALCQFVPYRSELSATPITSDSKQYYRLMNVLDRSLSPRKDETFAGKYNDRYYAVNRGDYDLKGSYKTTVEIITPLPSQIGAIHGSIFKVLKGTGAIPQVDALTRILKSRLREGKQCIVYVNFHDSREWIEQHLNAEHIGFVALHGRVVKSLERKAILESFSRREVQVLLTSVSESLNIDADVVIFYEFTTKLKQVMGRAHRGLDGKTLELVFMLTRDTMEINYFLKYIYSRSVTIQKLLGKDYSEFISVGESIKKMDIAYDSPY